MRYTGLTTQACVVALLFASTLSVQAGPLLKWVDENGRIHYGDRVPPAYAKQERKILNDQGVEVKTIEAAKTPEQLAEEERLAKQRREQQRIEAERAAHDRMLLATFTSEDDMVMTRDGKIAAIDAVLRITRGRIERTEQALEEMTRRAALLERSGKPIPDTLHEEIRGSRAQIQQFLDYIASKRREQESIRREFESDIRRFRELRTAQLEGPDT